MTIFLVSHNIEIDKSDKNKPVGEIVAEYGDEQTKEHFNEIKDRSNFAVQRMQTETTMIISIGLSVEPSKIGKCTAYDIKR